MKRKVTFSLVLSLFVFLTSLETSAKSNIHRWAIAVMEDNSESPTIIEYYSELEKTENKNEVKG